MRPIRPDRALAARLARRLLRGPRGWALRRLSRLLGPAFAAVARTGEGTAECLDHGFLPVALHFYQPVFDPDAVDPELWERRHPLPGIAFAAGPQIEYLARLAAFADECRWPARPGPGGGYHYDNGAFGYSSACLLHSVVRLNQPARVLEVGAGMSTLVLAGALAANRAAGGRETELVSIDPYPSPVLAGLAGDGFRVVAAPVEQVPLAEFASLGRGDLLFIDSSHVIRAGGDVTFLYLEVLPRLVPGVIVHVHDIQFPYDYPRVYADGVGGPRYFWTEQYLLQAFLAMNPDYEVLLGGHFLQRDHPEQFARCFPGVRPEAHRATSSFYMRRVDTG